MKLLQKNWSPDQLVKYAGSYQKAYFAYATDPIIRERAASGGVISALLIDLISRKVIDGALLCRTKVMDGKVQPIFHIARDRESVLQSQGSKYSAVDFNQDALPLMREFNGRLAVAALPCDISNLRRACLNDRILAEKIILVISLFCGHNSLPELTEMVIQKITPQGATLNQFRYRQGHWRGQLEAEFDEGQTITKPFALFSNYQNLFFFCQQKCHHCHDHFGYQSDLSVGDIWSSDMKKNPIKHSAVIIRSEPAKRFFEDALQEDVLEGHQVEMEAICQGQARSMPFHYNISARSNAGKRLGINIKDTLKEPVRWNDYLAARMVLWNEKFSRTSQGRKWIERMPQAILRLYLLFLKGLQSF